VSPADSIPFSNRGEIIHFLIWRACLRENKIFTIELRERTTDSRIWARNACIFSNPMSACVMAVSTNATPRAHNSPLPYVPLNLMWPGPSIMRSYVIKCILRMLNCEQYPRHGLSLLRRTVWKNLWHRAIYGRCHVAFLRRRTLNCVVVLVLGGSVSFSLDGRNVGLFNRALTWLPRQLRVGPWSLDEKYSNNGLDFEQRRRSKLIWAVVWTTMLMPIARCYGQDGYLIRKVTECGI